MINLQIANEDDACELLKIYAPYVQKTAITFEYDIPSVEEFKWRILNTQKKYPYIVAEHDGQIVGYAYAGAFKGRAAYDWAVETSIYVKKDEKRMGIGKKLYSALESILRAQNILNLNACIAYAEKEDEHLTKNSVQFHEHLGFRLVGKFSQCGFKFGEWYDMVWMEKHIGEHKENPEKVKSFTEIREELTNNKKIIC